VSTRQDDLERQLLEQYRQTQQSQQVPQLVQTATQRPAQPPSPQGGFSPLAPFAPQPSPLPRLDDLEQQLLQAYRQQQSPAAPPPPQPRQRAAATGMGVTAAVQQSRAFDQASPHRQQARQRREAETAEREARHKEVLSEMSMGQKVDHLMASIVKGGLEIPLSTMEGVAVLAKGFDSATANLSEGRQAKDLLLYRFAGALRELLFKNMPIDERLADHFLMSVVPGALGSGVGFMFSGGVTGVGAKAIGLGTKGVRAAQIGGSVGLAAGGGVGGQYGEALMYGAPEEEARRAGYMGSVTGAIQVAPIANLLRRIPAMRAGKIGHFRAAAQQAAEETVLESVGHYGNNAIAKYLSGYDPSRELTDGLGTAAGAGAIVGALMGGTTSVVARGQARRNFERMLLRAQESAENEAAGHGFAWEDVPDQAKQFFALRAIREELGDEQFKEQFSDIRPEMLDLLTNLPSLVEQVRGQMDALRAEAPELVPEEPAEAPAEAPAAPESATEAPVPPEVAPEAPSQPEAVPAPESAAVWAPPENSLQVLAETDQSELVQAYSIPQLRKMAEVAGLALPKRLTKVNLIRDLQAKAREMAPVAEPATEPVTEQQVFFDILNTRDEQKQIDLIATLTPEQASRLLEEQAIAGEGARRTLRQVAGIGREAAPKPTAEPVAEVEPETVTPPAPAGRTIPGEVESYIDRHIGEQQIRIWSEEAPEVLDLASRFVLAQTTDEVRALIPQIDRWQGSPYYHDLQILRDRRGRELQAAEEAAYVPPAPPEDAAPTETAPDPLAPYREELAAASNAIAMREVGNRASDDPALTPEQQNAFAREAYRAADEKQSAIADKVDRFFTTDTTETAPEVAAAPKEPKLKKLPSFKETGEQQLQVGNHTVVVYHDKSGSPASWQLVSVDGVEVPRSPYAQSDRRYRDDQTLGWNKGEMYSKLRSMDESGELARMGQQPEARPEARPEAVPAPAPDAALPSMPTVESATEQMFTLYPSDSVTDVERRNQFMRGFADAVAGKDAKVVRAGMPYHRGYVLYDTARRQALKAEREALGDGVMEASTGPVILGNIELTSMSDPAMARFRELPAPVRKRLVKRAIDEIVRPIARAYGITGKVGEGLGSWFSEGNTDVADSARISFPARTPDAVIRAVLARASLAMRQAGYFAARKTTEATDRWAVQISLNRSLLDAEYRNIIDTISRDAPTFNGTTLVDLKTGTFQIILNEGIGRDGVEETIGHIAKAIPDYAAAGSGLTVQSYQVEVIEGYGENTFVKDIRNGGDAAGGPELDSRVRAAYDSIAAEAGGELDALPLPYDPSRADLNVKGIDAPIHIPVEQTEGDVIFRDPETGEERTKWGTFWRVQEAAGRNLHGLMEFLRMKVRPRFLPSGNNNLIGASSNRANVENQLKLLDEAFALFPNPMESEEAFGEFLAYALQAAEGDVPMAPYAAIARVANPDLIREEFSRATPKQVADTNEGLLRQAKAFRDLYENGIATEKTTARLVLWGMLSRGVNVYTQESAFLDAVFASDELDAWVDLAVAGLWDNAATKNFDAWVKLMFPKGSPGRGASHNMNAFGKDFLAKMSQPITVPVVGPGGVSGTRRISGLTYLHELIADSKNYSGRDVRREFHRIVSYADANVKELSPGFDNKVLSFIMLVTGRTDVMVLDRVRIRVEFNDGRFGSYNLYEGVKGARGMLAGSGVAPLFNGVRGLLYYEAIEDAYAKVLPGVYEQLGDIGLTADMASVGHYHWLGWVVDSAQEVGHGTIDAVAGEAQGIPDVYNGVGSRQGKMNEYSHGGIYSINNGVPMVRYPVGQPAEGEAQQYVYFAPDDFRRFIKEIGKAKNGVVPSDFKVSNQRSAVWWNAEGVNREALDALARRLGESEPAAVIAAYGGEAGAPSPRRAADIHRERQRKKLVPQLPPELRGRDSVSPQELVEREMEVSYGPRSKLPTILSDMLLAIKARLRPEGSPILSEQERLDSIERNMVDREGYTIVGQVIDSVEKLALALRPFRDPRFEHSHWILLDDDGRILFHSVDTSGLGTAVKVNFDRLNALNEVAKKYGATRVVAVHNHPSGDTTASDSDNSMLGVMRMRLAKLGLRFEYGLILDHTEATQLSLTEKFVPSSRPGLKDSYVYEPTETKLAVDPGQVDDWTIYSRRAPEIYGAKAAASTAAAVAKQLTEPDTVMVLYMDASARVVAMSPHKVSALTRAHHKHGWLDRHMRVLGAYSVAIATDSNINPGSFEAISDAMTQFSFATDRVVLDVVDMVTDLGTARASARQRNMLPFDTQIVDEGTRATQVGSIYGAEQSLVMREGVKPYDSSITEPGQPEGEVSPRAADLQSEDIVKRVAARLSVGKGNEQYADHQIALAIIVEEMNLAKAMLRAPEGRGAYPVERDPEMLASILSTDPQHLDKVKSPTVVIREISEALRIPILATGNRWSILRRKGVQGAYRPGVRVIRIKNPGDIETAMRGVGHHIHELVYGLKPGTKDLADIPPRYIPEMKQLGKGSVQEGVAEFFRRYVTNPDQAKMVAPLYHDHVVGVLAKDHPAVLEALQRAQADFNLWRTATDAARLRSRISSAMHPDPDNPNRSRWDEFMEAGLNDLHYIQKMVEQRLGKDAPIEMQVHLLAQLARGSGGMSNQFLHHGTIDWATLERKGPSLREILYDIMQGGAREDFTAYAVARRAIWMMETKGLETGISLDTAKRTVAQLGSQMFEEKFDQLVTYNRHLLEMLRDSGVIDAETFARIEEYGGMEVFVPFHRDMGGAKGAGREKNLFLSKGVLKRLQGSTADIIDPLESIIKNTHQYAEAAFRQQVGAALVGLAQGEGAGGLMDLIQPATVIHTRKFSEVWAEIDKETGGALGTIPDEAKESVARIFRPGDFFGKSNVISIMENGERKWYEVTDPDLFKALTGASRQELGLMTRWMAKVSGWRRAGAILAPEFMVRNPLRDQTISFIQSEYGYIPFLDLASGVKSLITKDESYRLWEAAGGTQATLVDIDRVGKQAALDLFARKSIIPNVVTNPIQALQVLSALMENGTRLGEFKNAMEWEMGRASGLRQFLAGRDMGPGTTDKKVAAQRAAIASREVTTDYARHGTKTAAVRAIATFWNAGLQGDARTLRAFTQPHTRRAATMKAILTITIPSIALALINADDDEYWEIPQWQRDLFWMVKVPVNSVPRWAQQTEESGAAGRWLKPYVSSRDGVWVRLPKPFGLGQVFGSIPERAIEWMYVNDPEGLKDTTKNLMPWGGSAMFGGVPDIAAIQPFVENYANYSRFLRRPLVPRRLEGVEDTQQFTESTSEFAKWATRLFKHAGADKLPGSRALGLTSPMKFENTFRSVTAGLGGHFLQGVDLFAKPAARAANPDRKGDAPPRDLADVPLAKAFIARNPTWQSESMTRFYEERVRTGQVTATYNEMKRQGRVREAELYRRRNLELWTRDQQLAHYAEYLAKLRGAAAQIENSEMDRWQKREMTENYGRIATAIAAQALDRPYKRRLSEGRGR
jgi:hypothetical protein